MAPTPDTLALLTLREAAKLMHISPNTLRRLISAGDLPAVRIPGRRRTRRVLLRRRDLAAALTRWSEPQ